MRLLRSIHRRCMDSRKTDDLNLEKDWAALRRRANGPENPKDAMAGPKP